MDAKGNKNANAGMDGGACWCDVHGECLMRFLTGDVHVDMPSAEYLGAAGRGTKVGIEECFRAVLCHELAAGKGRCCVTRGIVVWKRAYACNMISLEMRRKEWTGEEQEEESRMQTQVWMAEHAGDVHGACLMRFLTGDVHVDMPSA
jgi:hypothetical protein